MKIKTLIGLIIIALIVFIIYILNVDKDIYYVNISDSNRKYNSYIKKELKTKSKLEKYVNYVDEDYRITDLINDINTNKNINDNQTIQNALIKADILTIKIGSNELEYKANNRNINKLFDYSDEMIKDLEELFKLLKIYDKEKIYFIGFYNKKSPYYDEIYNYLNLKIQDMCNDYDIDFINIGDLDKKLENIKVKSSVLKYLQLK